MHIVHLFLAATYKISEISWYGNRLCYKTQPFATTQIALFSMLSWAGGRPAGGGGAGRSKDGAELEQHHREGYHVDGCESGSLPHAAAAALLFLSCGRCDISLLCKSDKCNAHNKMFLGWYRLIGWWGLASLARLFRWMYFSHFVSAGWSLRLQS